MRRVAAILLLWCATGLSAVAQTSRAESRPETTAMIEAGRVHEQEGRVDEALASYERALATAEADDDGRSAAKALFRLARMLTRLGRYDEARELSGRARAISESLGDETGIARAQQASAWITFRTGNRDEALAALTDASVKLDALGPVLDAAACHAELSTMLSDLGRYERAIDEATRAIHGYEAVNDRFRAAFLRASRADARIAMLDFSGGIAELESAIKDVLAFDNKAAAALLLTQLAFAYTTLARHDEALSRLNDARAIYEGFGDRPNLALVAAVRARALTALGRYREALDDAEGALVVLETVNPESAALICELIGAIQHQLFDPTAARAFYERALVEFERLGDRESARRVRVELAYIAQNESDTGAIQVYEGALERARDGQNRLGAAYAMWKLGTACFDLRRHDEAVSWLEKSADAFRALTLTREVGMALSLLVRVHCERGDFAEALVVGAEALGIEERLGERANIGRTLSAVARAKRKTGAPRESVALAKRAIDLENDITSELGAVESEWSRRYARDASDEGLLATIEAGAGPGVGREARIDDALWFIEQSRSRVLGQALANRLGVLARRVSVPTLSAVEAARVRLDAARHAHDRLGAESAPDLVKESTRTLAAAGDAWDTAIARVHREARRVADLAYPRPVERDALVRALPSRTAFVAFQVTRERVIALALDSGGSQLVDLGAVDEIVRKVESYCRFLSSPTSADDRLSRSLYEVLLRPIETVLLRNDRLLVSPDGVLNVLSFDALTRSHEGVSERVIERWSVSCIPSGTILAILRNDADAALSGEGVLALGDPVYPAEETAAASRPARRIPEVAVRSLATLERLPGSGDEARAVADLVPEDRRVLLLRRHATRERLLGAMRTTPRRFRAVHLACHGVVDTERPRLSGIVLGGGAVLGIDDLFGMEVPADLAVLSACQTAGSVLARGEGLIGLLRGFMAAGCPRVIASNWKVADTSTRDLMVRLHERILKDGAAPDAALRAAKIERLRAGGRLAHPYYWASFVLWGLPD